jgi:phage tail protein X
MPDIAAEDTVMPLRERADATKGGFPRTCSGSRRSRENRRSRAKGARSSHARFGRRRASPYSPQHQHRRNQMNRSRFALSVLMLSLSTVAFAQGDSQKAFEKLKTLAGTWEGKITTTPKQPEIEGNTMTVTFRVTSMGNTLMHEMTGAGQPDDPITMLYLDADRLMLTHYCDAGNRPRMAGKMSEDEKTVEFDFVDVAGSTHYGHMHHAVFTFIDANHHAEDWTYMMPGDKPVRAHVDVRRKQ